LLGASSHVKLILFLFSSLVTSYTSLFLLLLLLFFELILSLLLSQETMAFCVAREVINRKKASIACFADALSFYSVERPSDVDVDDCDSTLIDKSDYDLE
jgi:hypothetical protein